MAGKRASMREGPLAALFRRTEELAERPQEEAKAEQAAPAAQQSAPAQPQAAQPAAPQQPAREQHFQPQLEPQQPAPAAQPQPAQPVAQQPVEQPAPAAAPAQPQAQARPAAPEQPQAAASAQPASEPATPAGAARREIDPLLIHGPKEPPAHPRETGYPHPSLAFSDDIPEDILASPEPEPAPAAPATDPFARSAPEQERVWGMGGVSQPVIRVVGVGGAGVNAVNRMVEAQVTGVEFLAVNTDLQSLQQSNADITLHIGPQITRGLGAGSDPELGRQAAMEEYDKIKSLLKGSDMVFIAAGAGGGTGTGAAPVVARIAREIGALTVGIVTKPFGFEGSRRAKIGEEGVEALHREVDTLIVVPNNRLLSVLDKRTSMVEAFRVADDVLRQGVQGISDLVTLPGIINLDFADVRTIMSDAGMALLGIGMGAGEQRALMAAEQAIASPLLETSMDGARSILLSITGGPDLSLWEVNEAAKAVSEAAHPDANIIFGAMVDEKITDGQVWVTVVATRYAETRKRRPQTRLEEPAGEPRVERRTPPRREERITASRRTGSAVDMPVPEFMPNR